jgi:uncharacterized ferritin-like protein (DUF455 family)
MKKDEHKVIELIRQRLEQGNSDYGDLHIDSDERDFLNETLEELLDGIIYLAIKILQKRKNDTP